MKLVVSLIACCIVSSVSARAEETRSTVVLLHGLHRTSWSMGTLARAFEQRGHRVLNIDYPSTRDSIAAHADRLARIIDDAYDAHGGALSVVTHSMGGIVLRAYADRYGPDRIGRVVMLAPPNEGSEIVDEIGDTWWFQAIMGPAGTELGTDSSSTPSLLPPVPFELGVIAGDAERELPFSGMLEGADDGIVGVERTKVAGMSDFLVVPFGHTFIMNRAEVIEHTITFIESGSFRHDERTSVDSIDWDALPELPLLTGDRRFAYRDPAAHYHEGVFRIFHTLVEREPDGRCFWYVAVTESRDLVDWSAPRILTPRDRTLNYSSPGNVVRHGDEWLLCLQTYPTPNGERRATSDARIFVMRSRDLEDWSDPELLRVKGPDVARQDMERMIDPYLVRDRDDPSLWWCFYKQNGVSMSRTRDFETWEYVGSTDGGENACILIDGDEYVLFHSPRNGIGTKRSADLANWRDCGATTLGQGSWPWAQGRITAGHVLDLRDEPGVGRYVMFFHGSTIHGNEVMETHGEASLGYCWSRDLVHWQWPGGMDGDK